MTFGGITDRDAIEAEMPWDTRDTAVTLYGLLSDTARKFPKHNAVSYQIFSGPKDKAETLNWSQLHAKTTQAANMFRKLGVGQDARARANWFNPARNRCLCSCHFAAFPQDRCR